MVESKGWDWERAEQSFWLKPVAESYFFADKWRDKGFCDFLDLGTGLGRHAIYFARQGFKVSALDISEYAVEHLSSWAAHEGLSVSATAGDMLSLPYADNSFDCILAYHVITHSDTEGVRRIISELERVLRPGGEVFFSLGSKESLDFREATSRLDENTIISVREPEVGIPHYYTSLDEVKVLLSGFELVSVKLTEYCVGEIHEGIENKFFYINAARKLRPGNDKP